MLALGGSLGLGLQSFQHFEHGHPFVARGQAAPGVSADAGAN
jgi:hypothetical protein